MTQVLAKSSAEIRIEWVKRYRWISDGDNAKAHLVDDQIISNLNAGSSSWTAGDAEILEWREGFNEHGPVEVAPKVERRLAAGWIWLKDLGGAGGDWTCSWSHDPFEYARYAKQTGAGACCAHADEMGVFQGDVPPQPPIYAVTEGMKAAAIKAVNVPAPAPKKEWIAGRDEQGSPSTPAQLSVVSYLPDRYGTARTKLERENQMWRPRWR